MSPIRPVAFVIFALSLLAFYTSVLEGKLAANDARAVGPPYTQRNNGPAIKVLKSVDSSSIAHRHFQRLNPSRRPRRSLNTSLPTHRPTITARVASKYRPTKYRRSLSVRVANRPQRVKAAPEQVTGVVFEPFSEVQIELATVDKTDSVFHSFARSDFSDECEAALNEQINVEYNISYVYHALYAYFDRDNVALPGLAEYFDHQSAEEREHAEKLMEYQNKRGGRVKLMSITSPRSEFYHKEKGDALYAMELSLSLEKLNLQKLRDLWLVADKHKDPALCDFIEGELLSGQVEDVKKVSEYVSQLRRVGTGHGVFHFDRVFQNGK